jgi:hypothetical protein
VGGAVVCTGETEEPTMTRANVTELPRRLEPVSTDDFAASLPAALFDTLPAGAPGAASSRRPGASSRG